MQEVFIVHVDHICDNCGMHNLLEEMFDQPVQIVVCGGCGDYILTPENFDDDDKALFGSVICDVIKGDLDVGM